MNYKKSLIALLGILLIQPAFSHIKTLEVLDQAPAFSLKGQDGKTYSSKDYKGKIVVMEWFNDSCPFVEKHYGTGNMQNLQATYTASDKGVVWFSVSSTKPTQALRQEDAAKIYADRKSKATALLLDTNGDVARAFGAKTTPHMFVINTDGKIAYMGAIDDNDSFRKDTVKSAKNYVAEALDALLNKKPIAVPQTKSYGCSVKIGEGA
jgi:peroxiredoxin